MPDYLAQTINLVGDALIWVGLALLVYLAFKPWKLTDLQGGLWHEHDHLHDKHHSHEHSSTLTTPSPHYHLHFHPVTPQ